MVAGLLPVAGMGVAGVGARAVQTMTDTKKGNISNKLNCASEHIKNDLSAGLALGVPTGLVTVAAYKRPKLLTQLVTYTGNGMAKVAKFLQKHIKGLGEEVTKGLSTKTVAKTSLLDKIIKNPKKAGKIGLAVAAVLYALNAISNHSEKAGRIEQKYEDKAKLDAISHSAILG